MLKLDQDTFITQFVTTFLAHWAAKHYDTPGEKQFDMLHAPVQPAIVAARLAWYEMLSMGFGPQQMSVNPLCGEPNCPLRHPHVHFAHSPGDVVVDLTPTPGKIESEPGGTSRFDHGAPNE